MANHLRGIIQRVTFHNPETGYAVLRVEVPGMRDLATVVGKVVSVAAGEQIDAEGDWIRDPKHGEQFQASEIRCRPPSTLEGIEKYLGSGLIKGIGPTYARKIVEVFGERTLQVIEESPTFLKEIRGIGPQRIARIRESWRQQKTVRDIMVFLQSYGLGTQRAVRIYKTYGDNAVDLIRENPYRLATDIWGVGFQTADELASRLGVDPASPRRARAALLFTLRQLAREGHVGCPEDLLLEQAMRIPGLLLDVLQETGQKMASEGEIVVEPGSPPWWYLRQLFIAESEIAYRIVEQQTGPHPLNLADPDKVIDAIEQRMGLRLAAGQREALRQAGRQKVLVLTGGPGTGKSTIVRGLVELFEASGLKVLLAAPTGRAAKRLGETTRRDARTIHRLLEFDPTSGGFKRMASHPLEMDLLVVDEVSMVDVPLMNHLLQAVPRHACLVLVGDRDQLPSVGPGSVLADLLAFEGVGVARLTEIFRQAEASWIVRAAHAVRQGELPPSAPPGGEGDFYFLETDDPPAIQERILTMARERIPRRFGLDPLRDIQILTPMNRSELGAEALNHRLQEVFNPGEGKAAVQRFGCTFRVGDKVMQTENDYDKEVFNGDIGRISRIDEAEREVVVNFEGREVAYDFGELDELTLAYAMTIHKSQGSEYPAVILPLHTQHFLLLRRNLLYTGITRGKRLVVVIGSKKALAIAVRNQDTSQRFSRLRERLRREFEAQVKREGEQAPPPVSKSRDSGGNHSSRFPPPSKPARNK